MRNAAAAIACLLLFGCEADKSTQPNGAPQTGTQFSNSSPALMYPAPAFVAAAAFSPDGKYLATAYQGDSRNSLILWDATTGNKVHSWDAHKGGRVGFVSFTPDSKQLVSAGSSDSSLKVWDVASGKQVRSILVHEGGVTCAALSPDGQWALTCGWKDMNSRSKLKLWDLGSGLLVRTVSENVSAVSLVISPNNKLAIAGSREALELWEIDSGKLLRKVTGFDDAVGCFLPTNKSVVWSKRLVEANQLKTWLALWSVETGEVIKNFEGEGGGLVTVSSDGKRVLASSATISADLHDAWTTFKVWDVETGKVIHTLKYNHIEHMGAYPGHGLVMDAYPSEDFPKAVAYSPDGKRVFLSCGNNWVKGNYIRNEIWDLETGQMLLKLKGEDIGR